MINADDFATENKSFIRELMKKHGWNDAEAVRYLVNYAQNRIETLARDRAKNGLKRVLAAAKKKPAKKAARKAAKKVAKPVPVAKAKRELTPQQRAAKQKRDRDRRAAKKAPPSATEAVA